MNEFEQFKINEFIELTALKGKLEDDIESGNIFFKTFDKDDEEDFPAIIYYKFKSIELREMNSEYTPYYLQYTYDLVNIGVDGGVIYKHNDCVSRYDDLSYKYKFTPIDSSEWDKATNIVDTIQEFIKENGKN